MAEPVRQKWGARVILLAAALFGVIWLLKLDHARKISTNVLDLIPTAEQSPEIGLVRGFASNVQARVMLFALSDPRSPAVAPVAAARDFAAELRASPLFAEVVRIGDEADGDALGRQVF